jgi:ATP-dependent Clp protease ATP-binding subunit ClpA
VTVEAVHLVTYRREDGATAEIQLEDEIQLDTGPEPSATVISTSSAPATLEFTDRAHQILTAARESATKSHRAYADSVDVLLAMLCETRGIAASALKALGLDCRIVERALRETVSRDEASTGYLKSLLVRSTAAAKWLDDDCIGTEHLLLAMCQIRPSAATDILTRLGAQPRDVCQEVLNVIGHDGDWQRWLADHPEL